MLDIDFSWILHVSMMLGQVDRTMKLARPSSSAGVFFEMPRGRNEVVQYQRSWSIEKEEMALTLLLQTKGKIYIWFWTSGSTFNGTDR